MRNFLFMVIILVLLYVLLNYAYREYNRKRLSKRLSDLLAHMEDIYGRYIQQRLTMDILHNDSIDFDKNQLLLDCTKQLLPYIEALHYQMQQILVDEVDIKAETHFFSNVKSLIEGYYANTDRRKAKFRMPLAYERIEAAFKKAIEADIDQRIVKMRTRSY